MFLILVAIAVLLAGAGVLKRSPWLLLGSAALIAPLALYLAATPRFRYTGLLFLVPPIAGALTVRRRRWLAGLLTGLLALAFVGLELYFVGSV